MNLRVLHISPYYLPDVAFGGPVFSVSALCESLAASGVDVTVFTIGYNKNDAAKYPLTKQLHGVTVRYFKGDWGKPCQVSWQLWEALEKEAGDFDVVHLHTWWNILVFKAIRIIKGKMVPLLLSPRGMMSNYSFSHRKTFLKRWFQSLAGSQLLEGVHLHATALAEAADMANRCKRSVESITVLPNLLALKESTVYKESGTKGYTLGFLSRLHHKKGIEVLLDAVARCPEVAELVIGGSGEPLYEAQLQQQVKRLGIENKVRFAGWIGNDKKATFFDQFQVFILPSFNENFANVVAEAWAAGKPTIVSTEVGLSNYVSQYQVGWICQPTVDSTAAAITQALVQKDCWPAMGKAAIDLVASHFTDAQIISHYLKTYETIRIKEGHDEKAAGGSRAKNNLKDVYILGINAYHADASAALLHNGMLVAAIEEERFRRVKHWAGFPSKAIEFCLEEAGITASKLSYIAIGRDPKAKWAQKARFALQHPGAMAFALRGRLSNAAATVSVENELADFPGDDGADSFADRIIYVEHHRSHLASAFYASPFKEAALLSIDGSGDFSTTMMGIGRDRNIEVLQSIDFPHSLGIFYTAFTQLLGFPYYGDEYKVMGLAPYGEPLFVKELENIIIWQEDGTFRLAPQWFRPPEKGYVLYDDSHQPQVPVLFSKLLADKFGPVRKLDENITQHHKNLAASVQHMTEQTIFHMLRSLYANTGLTDLCLAGGVAQNSVANGKITSNTPFKRVYIPPAGHDAGLSIGAAMYVQHQLQDMPRIYLPSSPYTGSKFTNTQMLDVLKHKPVDYTLPAGFDQLCEEVVACITNGGVIGWFRGRCEFGPRALGNRSILADPRREDAKELLNQKIKRRENFRPFAPSILKEYTAEYFEQTDDVPYMEKVFKVKKDKRQLIPAVTHADGSGRLQTVSKALNEDYYQLIDTFRQHTGIPVLLNTSFNENEPIVNSPLEALDCFLRTSMDMLVLEDYIIKRKVSQHIL
jgi:carbamoyltransferase